jgi:glycosyltransferase involved in cell wall biosynthesis
MADRPLHVALIGSRGIPNRYGGYETLMEELAARLVAAGVEVTVYCRRHSTPPGLTEHAGAQLVVLPSIRTKHLDTPVHTFLSCLHAATKPYDAALVVNSANAMFVPILKLGLSPVALHVDGIEERRAKWGRLGSAVYAVSERLAAVVPDRLVTDAHCIEEHYEELYRASSTVISYGVEPEQMPLPVTLRGQLGIQPRKYFLYVSRFEPENNPHRVAEAYRAVGGELPLVMVGGAPYADEFIESFTRGADRRIIFPGPIYGDGYRQLLSNATAYIQATEVGGTHPALVEAMGYGNVLLVNESVENREAAGDAALYFNAHQPSSLAERMNWVLENPDKLEGLRQASTDRAAKMYDWNVVTATYLQMFEEMAGRQLTGASAADK